MKDDVLATWDGLLSLVGLVLSHLTENDPMRDSNGAGIQDARAPCASIISTNGTHLGVIGTRGSKTQEKESKTL